MARRNPHPKELPQASQEARLRALTALSRMREGASLTSAAEMVGTTLETVKKYAGTVLIRQESGQYKARAWDRLSRPMSFLTARGVVELEVKDSRSAARVARYMSAVDKYLKTGDRSMLRKFRGKSVTVDRVARPFITDPETLQQLAAVGEVSFEELYTLVD